MRSRRRDHRMKDVSPRRVSLYVLARFLFRGDPRETSSSPPCPFLLVLVSMSLLLSVNLCNPPPAFSRTWG